MLSSQNLSSAFLKIIIAGLWLSFIPAAAFSAPGKNAISAGVWHTCALTPYGGVKCWGANTYGQLGNGTTVDSEVPVFSRLFAGVSEVAAGRGQTCVLTSSGGVKCWGVNDQGQLGNANNTNSSVPVDVSGLGAGITAVAVGSKHACALTSGGQVKCWGANDSGQLGNESNTDSNIPVDVAGLDKAVVSAVAAGKAHTCVLTSKGTVKCWGANAQGQLGNIKAVSKNVPTNVWGLGSGISEITAGWTHNCALTSAGDIRCWGANEQGQLGNGTNTDSIIPVKVNFPAPRKGAMEKKVNVDGKAPAAWDIVLINYAEVKAGNAPAARNKFEVNAGNAPAARKVAADAFGGARGISAIAAGGGHTCVLTSAGAVKCWGGNEFGQHGDLTTKDSGFPVEVYGLGSGSVAITAGGGHNCALTSAGEIECWGNNHQGQLGDGTITDSYFPVGAYGFSTRKPIVDPEEMLTLYLAGLQVNPWDKGVRLRIIQLVQWMAPAPQISEEARRHFMMAESLLGNSKDKQQCNLAIEEYSAALMVAPWWPEAYYNLGLTFNLIGEYQASIAVLKYYLATNPPDAREVQDRIYQIEAESKGTQN